MALFINQPLILCAAQLRSISSRTFCIIVLGIIKGRGSVIRCGVVHGLGDRVARLVAGRGILHLLFGGVVTVVLVLLSLRMNDGTVLIFAIQRVDEHVEGIVIKDELRTVGLRH